MYPFKNPFRMTSIYGNRIHPITGQSEFHSGLDLVCDTSDDVFSVQAGTVASSTMILDKSNRTWQWGNYVKVNGIDGVSIFYCHLASRSVVVGQKVKVGDLIGKEGTTGQSTGKHLHFECRRYSTKINAADYLGIPNKLGTYGGSSKIILPFEPANKQIYKYNDITCYEFPVSSFRLSYWDKPKNDMNKFSVAFNGGFFSSYRERVGNSYTYFSLPVGNICCDAGNYLPDVAKKYILEWTRNTGITSDNKIKMSCNQNGNIQFRDKKVSTLIIYRNGNAEIIDTNSLPSDCTYAIAGVPTVMRFDDVDYFNYVAKQWTSSDVMRPTMRNWIGIKRNGDLILMNYTSKTGNFVYGMEMWKKIKDFPGDIKSLIALDGGGSAYAKIDNNIYKTLENRRVNNIGLIL